MQNIASDYSALWQIFPLNSFKTFHGSHVEVSKCAHLPHQPALKARSRRPFYGKMSQMDPDKIKPLGTLRDLSATHSGHRKDGLRRGRGMLQWAKGKKLQWEKTTSLLRPSPPQCKKLRPGVQAAMWCRLHI